MVAYFSDIAIEGLKDLPRSQQRLMKLLSQSNILEDEEFDKMAKSKDPLGGFQDIESTKKKAFFHFCRSPKEFISQENHVYSTKLEVNELVSDGANVYAKGFVVHQLNPVIISVV